MKYVSWLILLFLEFTLNSQVCNKEVLYFRSGGYELNNEQRNSIDSTLNSFHPDSTYLIEIKGHTDWHGGEEKNIKLSKKRVKSVEDYILSKNLPNLVFNSMGYGEVNLVSKKANENRRVVLYSIPINSDRTIFLNTSNNGVQMELKIPVIYFRDCGICDSFPKIESIVEWKRSEYEFTVNMDYYCLENKDSNYINSSNCISAEYRFPVQYYTLRDNIQIPKPIYSIGCGNIPFKRDSVNVKGNFNFSERIDTVTNEYVLTHSCYRLGTAFCCGFQRSPCLHIKKISLPEQLTSHITVFTKSRKKPLSDSVLVYRDTTKINFSNCEQINNEFMGFGLLYGEPLFFKSQITLTPYQIVYDSSRANYRNKYYSHHSYSVPISEYKPLEYLDRVLILKCRKKYNCQEVGYYIEPFDYFVPFSSTSIKRFNKEWLDYSFSIRIKADNKYYYYQPGELKHRYNARKKKYKVKVKKKHLIPEFEKPK